MDDENVIHETEECLLPDLSVAPIAAETETEDKSEGVKMGVFSLRRSFAAAFGREVFNFWQDDEGDYMLQSQRERRIADPWRNS